MEEHKLELVIIKKLVDVPASPAMKLLAAACNEPEPETVPQQDRIFIALDEIESISFRNKPDASH